MRMVGGWEFEEMRSIGSSSLILASMIRSKAFLPDDSMAGRSGIERRFDIEPDWPFGAMD